ncbi:CBN-VAB-19 protein [Caenorhabditis brenneri]|uniref:CBN-VAB-19 protein n=1 Tax=Caenorhabditis brenneri TaxID=135651 RepID=G0NIN9_CAEBE|nr:CBN-VAB-19 protein [Caenorhabditis brenneri]
MRDLGGGNMSTTSSSASTSATIIKRSTNNNSTSSGVSSEVSPNSITSPSIEHDQNQNKSGGCDCCPYGLHLDLEFVSYAQNVSNGFVSRQGTPTNMIPRTLDRQLMSPLLDNSTFSDSLDNFMSDFDDLLSPQRDVEKKKTVQDIRNRMQGGYNSDYTTYRRGPPMSNGPPQNFPPEPPRRAHFEPTKPSPITRPMNLNLGFSGSRSNTPTQRFGGLSNGAGSSNGFSTALAKTVSEIRARNAESPFPDSRVGTPIDLGLHQQNGNGFHHSQTPTRFANPRYDELPPTPTPTFRRAPSQGDLPRGYSTLSHAPAASTGPGDFASLRRGREYALPPEQEHHSRVRFFSASPKMPRRGLQAGPSIDVESHFTYAQTQNGQKVLARTQSTSTSPPPEHPIKKGASAFEPVQNGANHQIQKPVVTRSIGVATGPLPAPKPCGECAGLRKELFLAVEKIPPPPPESCHVSTSTVTLTFCDQSVGSAPLEQRHVALGTEPTSTSEVGTVSDPVKLLHCDTQTDTVTSVDRGCSPIQFEEEITVAASSTATVSPTVEVQECQECLKRQDVFTRNVGVGACSVNDKICVNCDKQVEEADENEAPGFKVDLKDDQKQRDFEIAKANAVKKLLTNEQKTNFQRGTAVSKSARFDRKRSVDDLDYIVDKKNAASPATAAPEAPPTVPDSTESPLKSKVILKKEVIVEPPKQLPDPIPARIPRPKISKWAVTHEEEAAETPDEQEEAQDRLTPLRSDMRQLGNRWQRNAVNNATNTLPYSGASSAQQEDISDSDAESDCSAHSDATFEVNDDVFDAAPFEVSDRLREALENFNSSILEPGSVPEETVDWSAKLVRHVWMTTAGNASSRYENVDKFVQELGNLGPQILHMVVNFCDQNGNTALHYAVSHANFAVVSSILDSGECDLDAPNRAGYTAVMLAALSQLDDELEKAVVHRLFQMGDVNAKASQHGQTALMLAVSHGKKTTTELLLACGANVNEQDQDGSTALMCAAEHGHKELVKMLLAENNCNASLTDVDNSTALSIALENDHREIGVMIYAYLNYGRLDISGPTSTI